MIINKAFFLLILAFFGQTSLGMEQAPKPSLLNTAIEANIARELIDEVLGKDRGPSQISEQVVKSALEKLVTKYPHLSTSQLEKFRAIALKAATKPKLGMPGFEAITAISMAQTHNIMGVELQISTPFHDAFFEQIVSGQRVLDVGCAFGHNTKRALERRALVLAIDIEPAHLAVLVRDMDQTLLADLQIDLGSFPEEIALGESSFDLVVLGQVLHFLTPDQVSQVFFATHDALKTDGKVILMVMTLNCSIYSKHIEILKSRAREGRSVLCSNRPDGLLFPLYINEIKEIPEFDNRATHPQDQFITAWNLCTAGFAIKKEGSFSLGLNTNGLFDVCDAGANNNYFFMVAQKSSGKKLHCNVCNKSGTMKCAGCKRLNYCGGECQRKDWPAHKKYCKANK